MRILVEHGDPRHANHGDAAMLVVALARLAELFPGATLAVRTERPDLLCRLDARARPAAPNERADLVVAAGGGYLTDRYSDLAIAILERLRRAARRGVPTALLGQGLGPATRRRLLRTADATLPELGLVLVREGRTSPIWARAHGARTVVVTQDDALELAVRDRGATIGRALGVSLRFMHGHQFTVARDLVALRRIIEALGAPLVGLPVSQHREHDSAALTAVLGRPFEDLPTMDALRVAAGECRVVLTNTYHGGVFALGQGASVVALYGSSYYRDKLLGLVHDFPGSVQALDVRGPDFEPLLARALTDAWAHADLLRPTISATADRWVATSRSAWQRLASL